jgi:hypothetical protein
VMCVEYCCGSFGTGGGFEFIPCVKRGGILILELRYGLRKKVLGTFYSSMYILFTSITAAAAVAASSPSSRPSPPSS